MLSLKVHEYATREGRTVITQSRPYLRLSKKDTPPLYVQEGRVYSAGGQEIGKADLPDWFATELAKAKPSTLTEVGWVEQAPQKAKLASPAKPPWECPECQAVLDLSRKGAHIGRHRAIEKRLAAERSSSELS